MGRKIPEQCRKENTLKQPEPQQPEDAEGSLKAPKPRGMCEAMRPYWRWQSENETLEEFLEQRRAGKTRGQATSLAKSPKERREKGRRRLAVDAWRMSIHGNREDTINNAARLAKDEKGSQRNHTLRPPWPQDFARPLRSRSIAIGIFPQGPCIIPFGGVASIHLIKIGHSSIAEDDAKHEPQWWTRTRGCINADRKQYCPRT